MYLGDMNLKSSSSVSQKHRVLQICGNYGTAQSYHRGMQLEQNDKPCDTNMETEVYVPREGAHSQLQLGRGLCVVIVARLLFL